MSFKDAAFKAKGKGKGKPNKFAAEDEMGNRPFPKGKGNPKGGFKAAAKNAKKKFKGKKSRF